MPIVNNILSSNRYHDNENYEEFCGLENAPFVQSYEPEEEEISIKPIPLMVLHKMTLQDRILGWIKLWIMKPQA